MGTDSGKKLWLQKMWLHLNRLLKKIDDLPLWWLAAPLLTAVLLPNFYLGGGSVFIIHDQLDESLMNYVLTARHLGEDTIPEMLGGLSASGLQPSSVLFLLFYCVLPPFYAFLGSYAVMVLAGFLGMYLAVKECTGSSLLAAASGGVFCLLPLYPVYGLSQMGIPLILYAYLCLRREKNRILALFLTLFFGLTSHLVYTGYVVLMFWGIALLVSLIRGRDFKRLLRWEGLGFLLLLGVYLTVNAGLIVEVLFGKGAYRSHREEMVSAALPFGQTVRDVFLGSAQHAPSYHEWLILPILALLVCGGIFYRRMTEDAKRCYRMAVGMLSVLVASAVFYGICKCQPVVDWRNRSGGFLHYFSIERFYWLYPAGWYLTLALAFGVWWMPAKEALEDPAKKKWAGGLILPALVFLAVWYPAADKVLENSYFYMNVNQYHNGSGITGYISWEGMYPEEMMQEIEDAIGRDMDSFRVAHLGISPAPALMHGFYTVDGYSDNYPLDYKHAFRKVIAAELDKTQDTAVYFDKWGSRCYLFNSLTGNYWMMPKDSGIVYEGLEFDMQALRELGCEYLFSGAQIADAERMGLKYMGYFETESSYWGIWLYELAL